MLSNRILEHCCNGDKTITFKKFEKNRTSDIKMSQPISRVLSWTVIYLGCLSPNTSSDLPEPYMRVTSTSPQTKTRPKLLFDLAPSGVFRAATVTNCAVRSYHTFSPLPYILKISGGLLSVALSVNSRFPGIIWHFTLRSPDFPPSKDNFKQRLSRPAQAMYHSAFSQGYLLFFGIFLENCSTVCIKMGSIFFPFRTQYPNMGFEPLQNVAPTKMLTTSLWERLKLFIVNLHFSSVTRTDKYHFF